MGALIQIGFHPSLLFFPGQVFGFGLALDFVAEEPRALQITYIPRDLLLDRTSSPIPER